MTFFPVRRPAISFGVTAEYNSSSPETGYLKIKVHWDMKLRVQDNQQDNPQFSNQRDNIDKEDSDEEVKLQAWILSGKSVLFLSCCPFMLLEITNCSGAVRTIGVKQQKVIGKCKVCIETTELKFQLEFLQRNAGLQNQVKYNNYIVLFISWSEKYLSSMYRILKLCKQWCWHLKF